MRKQFNILIYTTEHLFKLIDLLENGLFNQIIEHEFNFNVERPSCWSN